MRNAMLVCLAQCLGLIFFPCKSAFAHERHIASPAASVEQRVRAKLVDSPVVTQLGRRTTLPMLAGARVVVIDFVYTSCTTFCPVVSAIMDRVGRSLDERLGRDIVLITVTVDPIRDTPQRLAAYSSRFSSGQEWYWVTGEKSDIAAVLKGLGAYSPNPEDHPPLILVGHPTSGRWIRLNGIPDADAVTQRARALADEISGGGAKGEKR